MIHYNVCGGKVQLIVHGGFDEILTDSALMLFTLYRQLLKKNACAAEMYRDFFEHNGEAIFDPEGATEKLVDDVKKSVKEADEIDALLVTLLEKLKSKRESEEN